MERNTKHRVLGILVVVALVIISLPLFQTGKDAPTQTAAIKAPPFPEQTTTPVQAVATNDTQRLDMPATKSLSAANQAVDTPDDQPDDVITTLHPSVINAQQPIPNAPAARTPEAVADTVTTTQPTPVTQSKLIELPIKSETAAPEATADKIVIGNDADTEKLGARTATAFAPKTELKNPIKSVQASRVKKTSTHMASLKRSPKAKLTVGVRRVLKDDGLISLKTSTFVIQMGSFKNKTNALRLVNQLRANGYPAFIQKISTSVGENTRVFVGPSNKRTAARALANRLETDMHLRGIVISYQPLTL